MTGSSTARAHTTLRVPGEDLPAAVSLAATAVGVVSCALWLQLNREKLEPTRVELESRTESVRARSPAASEPEPRPARSAPSEPRAIADAAPSGASTEAPAPSTPYAAEMAGNDRPAAPAVCQRLLISFPSATARIAPDDAQRLRQLAAALVREPNATLLVRRHADGVGSDASNLSLSFQRAEAVAQSLSSHGIERARISVQGFGEYVPLEGKAPREGSNRRASIDVRGA